MANEIYLRQKQGNFNSRTKRVLTPTAGGLLGFDNTNQVKPTIVTTASILTNPVMTGTVSVGAAGAAGAVTEMVNQKTGTDNTNVGLFRFSIPNTINGGVARVMVTGTLGDGDSTDSKIYLVSFSRIAGANAKAVASSAVGAAQITGATGNATTTGSLTSVAGGTTAVNTFDFQAKVARSAGTADNHPITARVVLLNSQASGITIAAL